MMIYSRTALATDSNGNLTKLTISGSQSDELRTVDSDGNELLRQIYNQLKILNFHMSTITENDLEEIGE